MIKKIEICLKRNFLFSKKIIFAMLTVSAAASLAQTTDDLVERSLYAYSCDGGAVQAEKAIGFEKINESTVEVSYTKKSSNQENFKLCFDATTCNIPQDKPSLEDVPTPREYSAKWVSPDKIQFSGWTVGEPSHGKYRVYWRDSVLDLAVNASEGNSVIPFLDHETSEVAIECVGTVFDINGVDPVFTYKYGYSLGSNPGGKTCISDFEVTETLASSGVSHAKAFEGVQVARVPGSYYPSRDFSIFKSGDSNYNFSAIPDEGHSIRKRKRQHIPMVLTSSAPGESGGATTCRIVN